MPKISVRPDRDGQQAVYYGGTLLLRGLADTEAEAFAAFFQAADRVEHRHLGRSAPEHGRSRAARAGVLSSRGEHLQRARP